MGPPTMWSPQQSHQHFWQKVIIAEQDQAITITQEDEQLAANTTLTQVMVEHIKDSEVLDEEPKLGREVSPKEWVV